MRICLFADIHGNWPAFQAALPMILGEGADLNICLGDVCGYYDQAVSVIRALRTLPDLIYVRGNHDDIFLRAAAGDSALRAPYLERYGPSLESYLADDHREATAWLQETPLTHTDASGRMFCCHGGPADPLQEYVYPDKPLDSVSGLGRPWCFLAHTHYAMDRSLGGVRVINPGSVGQPRDKRWPRFAVVDLESGRAVFREVRFDKDAFAVRTRRWAAAHPYLSDVWSRIPA